MTHPETAPYAEGCMNLSTMPSQGYCAGPQEEEQTAVDAPAVGEKAPAPELGAAPGSEVVPGASDSHMGADSKVPPASAATAAATNGEDRPRELLEASGNIKRFSIDHIFANAIKFRHIFNPKHNLGRLGSPREAMDKIVKETFRADKEGLIPRSGRFEIVRRIDGYPVTIRGAIIAGGELRYGTVFIP